MIDPRRVTVPFVVAYLKWAIPMLIVFVFFLFSCNVSGLLVSARNENKLAQEQEIMKLQNELQATRAAKDTTNKNVTKVSVDASRLDSDKTLIGDFLGIYFNVAGEDQYQSMLTVIKKQFGTDLSNTDIFIFDPRKDIKLSSWNAFCETVYGTKYTWWCLVDYTADGKPAQCWLELDVSDGTNVQMVNASNISKLNY